MIGRRLVQESKEAVQDLLHVRNELLSERMARCRIRTRHRLSLRRTRRSITTPHLSIGYRGGPLASELPCKRLHKGTLPGGSTQHSN